MGNEQDLLQKRFIDLSKQANRKGIVIYSDFLNLSEQNILFMTKGKLETSYELSGGHEYAERKVAAFLPADLGYEWEYPLTCLKIQPAYPKFADTLTHRDVLGAVMHLGIERAKIGDILCQKKDYYLFCKENMAAYLTESLQKIRHTLVTVTAVDSPQDSIQPEFIEKSGIISSNRLDSIVACLIGCSRNEAVKLIQGGKVYANGLEILHNTYTCKEGDVLSVRSHGKYIFDSLAGETKKGRQKIKYRIYS